MPVVNPPRRECTFRVTVSGRDSFTVLAKRTWNDDGWSFKAIYPYLFKDDGTILQGYPYANGHMRWQEVNDIVKIEEIRL